MLYEQDRVAATTGLFDNWRALVIGLYMSLVGYAVLAGIPVISTAWTNLLGFSEVQVGRVASADLGGLACGALVASFLVAHFSRRPLVLVSIIIALVGNLLCTVYDSYVATLLLRFLAGIGSGLFTGIAVATLGGRSRPARAFNLLLFSFAFVQAGEMYLLPRLTMDGIYLVFACSYLVVLPFLHWIPAYPAPHVATKPDPIPAAKDQRLPTVPQTASIPVCVPYLFLLAMAITYINIGGYWTYIELATADAGLNAAWVSQVLIWVSLFSLLGCLVAIAISDRHGLAKPLLVTLVLHSLCVALLISGITSPGFLISVYTFNFLWIFIDVYQMGSVAKVDTSGRYAALMPAAQGLGQIVGPNLAAGLLALGLGYSWIFAMCAVASLAAFLIYAIAYRILGRSVQRPDNA